MKRLGYFTGIAACLAAAVSCQEDLETVGVENALPMITKTMLTEGNLWTDGDTDTKSIYDPEVGITMTGSETMAVFYGKSSDNGNPDAAAYMRLVKEITAKGNGKYTISHEYEENETYDYCVVSPMIHSSCVYANGDGTGVRFELSPVQTPEQTYYDDSYDILYGKGMQGVPADMSLEVTEFKRITAPVRFELYDNGNELDEGEKIYAMTASFGKTATSDAALAGLLNMNVAFDKYEDCKVSQIASPGNAVTALYSEGLQKQNGFYPVWFMVNPATFETGTSLTLTVTTDRRTFAKKIDIPQDLVLAPDQFNVIKMNLSDAVAASDGSLYFDFTGISGTDSPVPASDGKEYSWSTTGDLYQRELMPQALRLQAEETLALPSIPGYKITGIRLYANPANSNSDNSFRLNEGESYSFASYADGGVAATGGVLEIAVPEDAQGQSLVLESVGLNLISGIALELTEDSSSGLPEIDENDWYSQYVNGRQIIINGTPYSQETHGEAILVNLEDLAIADLNQAGVIFIDNSGVSEIKSLTANRFTAITGHPEGNVIIGRYRDSQPGLSFVNADGVAQQLSIERSVVLKNISISTDAASVFQNGRAASAVGLTLEDCTLSLNSTVATAVVLDNNASYSYADVTVNNCVIKINSGNTKLPSVFGFYKSSGFGSTDFTMTNSVVYAETSMRAYVINVSADYSDLNVSIADNTFNNIYTSNGLIYGNSFNSLGVKNNLVYDAQSSRPFVYCTESCQTSDISGNYLYSSWTADHADSVIETPEDSNFNYPASPFTSDMDASAGYFPIDLTVVTNGAGADYDTKYWIQKN